MGRTMPLMMAMLVWAGCAAPGQGAAKATADVAVALVSGQGIAVNGQPVAEAQVPGALRSHGAGAATLVRIAYDSTETKAAALRLAAALPRAGFPRVLLVGPREVKALAR